MSFMQDNSEERDGSEVSLSILSTLRNKYLSLKMRRTKLWEEINSFSRWFEFDASHLATTKNQDEIWIDLDADGSIQRLWIGAIEKHETLKQYRMLWGYLASLGIRKLCLDPRLEMNQILDLFIFLKGQEKALRTRDNKYKNSVSSAFLEARNIHFSCENIVLKDNALIVKYSYCTLNYSHLVHWLEERNKSLRDHRALFYMAPRYGVIVAGIILLPSMLLAALHSEWLILWLLLAAALALYGIAYVFLMVVGSVEYDNEESTYRLSRAYDQLKFYASRIQADIKRAQTIQQCFLPDGEKMPMSDIIDWASSYKPAEEVGGDFFDVQHLDDQIVIIFGDVCGHGMAAALITAVLKTTFQTWLETPTTLQELALKLNRNICLITPTGDFAAVFLATLNAKTGQMEYINCGHNPEPWLCSSNNNTPIKQLDRASSMILGIEEHIEIKKASVTLQPTDGVIIISDGIIESQNIEGDLYGKQRFEEMLLKNATLPLPKLANLIIRDVDLFSKDASLKDDQTLLAFRIKQH